MIFNSPVARDLGHRKKLKMHDMSSLYVVSQINLKKKIFERSHRGEIYIQEKCIRHRYKPHSILKGISPHSERIGENSLRALTFFIFTYTAISQLQGARRIAEADSTHARALAASYEHDSILQHCQSDVAVGIIDDLSDWRVCTRPRSDDRSIYGSRARYMFAIHFLSLSILSISSPARAIDRIDDPKSAHRSIRLAGCRGTTRRPVCASAFASYWSRPESPRCGIALANLSRRYNTRTRVSFGAHECWPPSAYPARHHSRNHLSMSAPFALAPIYSPPEVLISRGYQWSPIAKIAPSCSRESLSTHQCHDLRRRGCSVCFLTRDSIHTDKSILSCTYILFLLYISMTRGVIPMCLAINFDYRRR